MNVPSLAGLAAALKNFPAQLALSRPALPQVSIAASRVPCRVPLSRHPFSVGSTASVAHSLVSIPQNMSATTVAGILAALPLGIVASVATFRLVRAASELIWRYTFKRPTDYSRFGAGSGKAWGGFIERWLS